MKRIRIRHPRIAIVAGVVVTAILILVLAMWLADRGRVRLPQDGTYHYGQATIVIDSYWKGYQHRGGNIVWQAMGGYFPFLCVTVSCTEDCSLLLEPELRFPGFTTSGEVQGARYQEEVDLAAGETTSIVWAFERVDSDDMASTPAITVHDRTGQADSGKVVFHLREPEPYNPTIVTTTTTAGP